MAKRRSRLESGSMRRRFSGKRESHLPLVFKYQLLPSVENGSFVELPWSIHPSARHQFSCCIQIHGICAVAEAQPEAEPGRTGIPLPVHVPKLQAGDVKLKVPDSKVGIINHKVSSLCF